MKDGTIDRLNAAWAPAAKAVEEAIKKLRTLEECVDSVLAEAEELDSPCSCVVDGLAMASNQIRAISIVVDSSMDTAQKHLGHVATHDTQVKVAEHLEQILEDAIPTPDMKDLN